MLGDGLPAELPARDTDILTQTTCALEDLDVRSGGWPASDMVSVPAGEGDLVAGDLSQGHKHAATAEYIDTATADKPDPMRDVFQEFPYAMAAVAAVTAFGAKKHQPRGWRRMFPGKVDKQKEYHRSKIGRHLLAIETEGEVNHADGGNLHMAAVAWNALAYLDQMARAQSGMMGTQQARGALRAAHPSLGTAPVTE